MRETSQTTETTETSGTWAWRLARAIVRCYPRAWRTRYEAEALDLLALRTPTWGDLGNLAYHALYSWLHPDLLADDVGSAAGGLAALTRLVRAGERAIVRACRWAARQRRRGPRADVSSRADPRFGGDDPPTMRRADDPRLSRVVGETGGPGRAGAK